MSSPLRMAARAALRSVTSTMSLSCSGLWRTVDSLGALSSAVPSRYSPSVTGFPLYQKKNENG